MTKLFVGLGGVGVGTFPPITIKKQGIRKEQSRVKDLLFGSLISWVAPFSSPPWPGARPGESLGIWALLLGACSWLTYLFNYFTVSLPFKWRGPCFFFSALLFKTQAFHAVSSLLGLMAVTSTFDLSWPPQRAEGWGLGTGSKQMPVWVCVRVCVGVCMVKEGGDKASITQ